jgi:arylsulfatase A-like enzyme
MKKRSLVLVTVDCLRADHVGFNGYSHAVTPFLDSLARNSVFFTCAIAAGAPTYFSFPAIMTSRYPLGLGRDVVGIAPDEPTIATALRDAGHATAAFLAGNPYLSRRFGYHQGFDEFHDCLDSEPAEESKAQLNPAKKRRSDFNRRLEVASRHSRVTAAAYDELYFWYCQWRSAPKNFSMDMLRRYPAADVIVDRACSWLSGLREQCFFLWIHLMDPHHPYYPPPETLSEVGASHITARRARLLNSLWNRGDIGPRRLQRYRPEILSLYDAGVYWVDKQISRLVQVLDQLQRWDETVFVVTADHGEEFLEHGARYHEPLNLPEQLIHVPLLVRAPELSGMRISQPFSVIHLTPSLLKAVGTDIPDGFQGRSHWEQILTGSLRSETAIAECIQGCTNPLRVDDRFRPRLLAVRDSEYKLVIHFSDKTDYFYDLKNDPEERSPLPAGVQTRERVRLLQIAREHLRKSRSDRNVDLALRARLREIRQSLGTKSDADCASVASD